MTGVLGREAGRVWGGSVSATYYYQADTFLNPRIIITIKAGFGELNAFRVK